ncbi:TPA: pathogenicity island protein [Bacillus cereus]
MEGKIIQIIPAPVDLHTVYQDCETGELMKSRTLCLALTDEGEVYIMDIDDSGWIDVAEAATNFKGIEWRRLFV